MAGRADTSTEARSRGVVRRFLGGALLVVLVVGVGGLLTGVDPPWASSRSTAPRPATSASQPSRAATPAPDRLLETGALGALEQWDRRRSAAYATGSTDSLRRLYVSGSRAGEADVDLLHRYLRRGFHVRGMRTQVLALTVLDHREGRWRVRVTDRLVGAVATGAGRRVRLPQGQAGGYVLTLVRDGGGGGRWRVASVRPARAP